MLTAKQRKLGLAGIAAATLAGGVYLTSHFRNVSKVLDDAGNEAAAKGIVRFESVALDRHAPAGFNWVGGAASGYVDAAWFQNHLFLMSSSELTEFDADGARIASYRSGFELPPSALLSLTSGTATEAKGPELLVATATAGYLAFDGKAWRHVRMQEQLLSMSVLSNGRVLLGSDRSGLLVHDARGIGVFHEQLKDKRVTAIAGSDEADLWIGTLDAGLYRYRAGQLQRVQPTPDPRILWIAVDGVRVFAATPMGIAEFEDGRFKRELASGYFVRSLLVKGKQLLAGTLEDGLLEIPVDVRNPRPLRRETASGSGEIRKVFRANDREFVLTPTALLSGDQEVLRAGQQLLADGNVAALAPDESGRLWIGYFDRGLDVLDGATAKHVEDDTIFCVNRIVHDAANRRSVVATGNGLAFLDTNATVRKVLHKADGLIANHATDVLVRPSGAITVATPAGVTFLEASGQASSIYAFHGLVNNHVYALGTCQDRLMAGTLGGLSTLEGGLVKASFTTANSALRHNWITAIADAGSTCLVGTYGAGVMAFEPDGSWKPFADLGKFEVNPNALALSGRAGYAGSLGKGLAVWNRGTGRWNWMTEGLPSLNVTAVAVQGSTVFIGTDNGLVKVEEQVLVR
jgi:ligand-binding sensor domain-containing protein